MAITTGLSFIITDFHCKQYQLNLIGIEVYTRYEPVLLITSLPLLPSKHVQRSI